MLQVRGLKSTGIHHQCTSPMGVDSVGVQVSRNGYLERKSGSIQGPLEAMGSFVKLCGPATKHVKLNLIRA